VSSSDDFSSASLGAHVSEELPALIAGELDLDATREVTNHLRTCAECRQDLVEVAAGIGLMRRLDGLPETAAVAPAAPARRTRSRAAMLVAAAVIVVLVGVVTSVVMVTGGNETPRAKVALTPVSKGSADGTVAMQESGSAQAMEVATSLGAAPTDQYYEVWLLDRDTGKMLPVGVLPPDGRGTFRLPSEILAGYDSVDISLQPNDGGTKHSDDSVLRADYA
jgi:Anti-sigma-K factor rskA/Putative zinc-finger